MAEPADKDELRHRIWTALEQAGAARFPGARGRIPNFAGAEAAARRLLDYEPFARADVIKCNPDTPQRPVRHAALEAGKVVYMAVPKLAEHHPFLELDPASIPAEKRWEAASKAGAEKWGRPVSVSEMRPVDLIVTGCVGAASDGARLGKGGGYSDIEYGLLREAGLVDASTPMVSTVHPLQVMDPGLIAMVEHDISLDAFATPEALVVCARSFDRPATLEVSDEKVEAIPALQARARADG